MKRDRSAKKPNRLIEEKSPYLLQHAFNPVDWFPWGEAAFDKARRESKVIFLSIGYSTCHWCHVMERESFENDSIADVLNERFVPVKVDREERPDVDHVYMAAVQAISGSGGWPLSVFLSPDLKPFMGGTYFPPEDRWGRIGFRQLLLKVDELWKTRRNDVIRSGSELAVLLQSQRKVIRTLSVQNDVYDKAFDYFQTRFDSQYGGFGGAPKFPSPHQLSFLLRYWISNGDLSALNMVKTTLLNMARGGICDQLGGGFHRYSTDAFWLVPHFEKMLYDQAMLLDVYVEAYQASGDLEFRDAARDIANYVLKDLQHPEGGFYSAEDADSEGEEGTFYVWTYEEFEKVLGADVSWAAQYFGVVREGNFEGKNILNRMMQKGSIDASTSEVAERCRAKLLGVRNQRVRPLLDDKIIVAWNGLMIASLAKAAHVFEESAYLSAAQKAARFILENLVVNDRLHRRYRDQEVAIPGFQDDYAGFAWGLIQLNQADFDGHWIQRADQLMRRMLDLFWDEQLGGFFYTEKEASDMIVRSKDYYDGASPSGNSVACAALIYLADLTEDDSYRKYAEQIIASASEDLNGHPSSMAFMLTAIQTAGHCQRVVFSGELSDVFLRNAVSLVHRSFVPFAVLMTESQKGAHRLIPLKTTAADSPSVYICTNETCHLPARNLTELEQQIRDHLKS